MVNTTCGKVMHEHGGKSVPIPVSHCLLKHWVIKKTNLKHSQNKYYLIIMLSRFTIFQILYTLERGK